MTNILWLQRESRLPNTGNPTTLTYSNQLHKGKKAKSKKQRKLSCVSHTDVDSAALLWKWLVASEFYFTPQAKEKFMCITQN